MNFSRSRMKNHGLMMLIIGILILVIGLVALVVNMNSSPKPVDKEKASMDSTLLSSQFNDLLNGSKRMIGNGTAASSLKLDATASVGLYNTADGYATKPVAPAAAFNGTASEYGYVHNLVVKVNSVDLGSSAAEDTLVLYDLKLEQCKQFNRGLGVAAATPPTSTAAVGAITSGVSDITTGGEIAWATADNFSSAGCFKDSAGKYIAFMIVQQN